MTHQQAPDLPFYLKIMHRHENPGLRFLSAPDLCFPWTLSTFFLLKRALRWADEVDLNAVGAEHFAVHSPDAHSSQSWV